MVSAREEHDAFVDWVSEHVGEMSALARKLAAPGEFDDVVQTALISAWRQREKFDPSRGTARSWLLGIVANESRHSWRRRRHQVLSDVIGATEQSPQAMDVGLVDLVARLPWRQREAIALFYYMDLPQDEVARIMSCKPGTVKATLHAARSQLRTMLEVAEDGR